MEWQKEVGEQKVSSCSKTKGAVARRRGGIEAALTTSGSAGVEEEPSGLGDEHGDGHEALLAGDRPGRSMKEDQDSCPVLGALERLLLAASAIRKP